MSMSLHRPLKPRQRVTHTLGQVAFKQYPEISWGFPMSLLVIRKISNVGQTSLKDSLPLTPTYLSLE